LIGCGGFRGEAGGTSGFQNSTGALEQRSGRADLLGTFTALVAAISCGNSHRNLRSARRTFRRHGFGWNVRGEHLDTDWGGEIVELEDLRFLHRIMTRSVDG
jgi:hypothetical protein